QTALLRSERAVHDRPRGASHGALRATRPARRGAAGRSAPSHLLSERPDLLRSRDAGASLPEVPGCTRPERISHPGESRDAARRGTYSLRGRRRSRAHLPAIVSTLLADVRVKV